MQNKQISTSKHHRVADEQDRHRCGGAPQRTGCLRAVPCPVNQTNQLTTHKLEKGFSQEIDIFANRTIFAKLRTVSSVADLGCLSRIWRVSIPDPHLSSRKYDTGCSSQIRIRILFFLYPSRIPEPGVKKAPDPVSRSATLTVSKTKFCKNL